MVLKELVLDSLESLEAFIVDGKALDDKLYGKLANKEVKNYYLGLDKENNKPYMVVKLEEE